MTKQEAIDKCCGYLDEIRSIVADIRIGTDGMGHFHLLGDTSKNKLYGCVFKIKKLVDDIDNVPIQEFVPEDIRDIINMKRKK